LEVLEMNKIHVTAIALMLGISGALGIAAATNSAGLRAQAAQPRLSDAAVAKRQRQLAKAEKALRKARRSKPPALPAVPASRSSSRGSAQPVVFSRAAAETSHGDDDYEEDDDHGHPGHGGDDGGDDD
jgi:hypothetical protein